MLMRGCILQGGPWKTSYIRGGIWGPYFCRFFFHPMYLFSAINRSYSLIPFVTAFWIFLGKLPASQKFIEQSYHLASQNITTSAVREPRKHFRGRPVACRRRPIAYVYLPTTLRPLKSHGKMKVFSPKYMG